MPNFTISKTATTTTAESLMSTTFPQWAGVLTKTFQFPKIYLLVKSTEIIFSTLISYHILYSHVSSTTHYFSESCSFSLDCLKFYKGNTIIHIGEMFGETLSSNPWGQTTSRDFQIQLGESFRCVSRVQLPNWPGHMDSLTVWSRVSQPVRCDGADMVFVHLANPRYIGWNIT